MLLPSRVFTTFVIEFLQSKLPYFTLVDAKHPVRHLATSTQHDVRIGVDHWTACCGDKQKML